MGKADARPRRQRLAAGLAVAAAAAAVIALVWVTAGFAAVALPVAFVAACGLWACLLIDRTLRGTPLRWFRPLADAAGIAATTVSFLLLARPNLLTAEPAAGLLFPLAVWGSIRVWLAMKNSERFAAKAGADITLSLLLGAVLVIFLVWLANVLDMSRPEVAALRAVLTRAAAVADLPWWVWTGLYVLLAGASLAFALRPKRTATAKEWFERLRLVPVTNAARRVTSSVHIGLLAIVLVGLAAPAALATTIQRELAAAYTVALQRQFQAEGELAAYTRIRQLAVGSAPPTFTQVVTEVHDTSKPPAGTDQATTTEEELAQRVGALQAAALNLGEAQAVNAAAEADARRAGLDAPLRGEPDMADRVGEVDGADQNDDETESSASQAGELAAVALASTVSIANLGGHEVFQVVQEYLSGLVEESGVKDTFAAWVERLPGASVPPEADEVVAPNPGKLENAAYKELAGEFAAAGEASELADDQAVQNASSEPPIDAAVGLAEQTTQPVSTSCPSCTAPGGPDEPDDEAPPLDDGD